MIVPKVEVVKETETALVLNIQKTSKRVAEAVDTGVRKATIKLASYIKEQLLSGEVLKNRTGNLRRSIFFDFPELGVGVVSIGEEGWYGKLHELGVDHPWTITPKPGMAALHFKIDGQDVFVRSVEIPGLKERSFMRRGLREMHDEILEIIGGEVKHATA